MNKHIQNMTKLREDGFAPIIVSIIIVIVLSLLTIGFVTLADNNAQSALNRQLSNNAYYAADSGINDAIQAISHGFDHPKTHCAPLKPTDLFYSPYLSNNQINGPQDYYSCLLINPTPSTLQYSTVKSSQPSVVLLSTVDSSGNAVNPSYIIFSWEPAATVEKPPFAFAPSNYFPNCGIAGGVSGACLTQEGFSFGTLWQDASNKSYTGILRVALTPLYSGQTVPQDTSTTYTSFLYPVSGAGNVVYAPAYSSSTIGANAGAEVSGDCNNNPVQPTIEPYTCNVRIPIANSNTNGFILSMLSYYTDSRVTIEAYDYNNNQLLFRNAQYVIDSTGYDHGVQRRLQVRLSSLNDNGFSAYNAATSGNFCSDLQAYPPNLSTSGAGYASSACGL